MEILNIRGLSKDFSSTPLVCPILDRINFIINAGERVALLGTSGSGKTTLLNLIAGIDQPDAGEVVANGLSIHQLGEPQRTLWRRQHLGFVFQFFNLIPTLTVAENIALPLELSQTPRHSIEEKVFHLLQQIELPNCAERYPDTLSGGEQQRVAIARALAHKPSLLLADEPTGNLDDETGEHILDLLMQLTKAHQMTMLIVTHSQRVAAAADRKIKLHKGQLQAI